MTSAHSTVDLTVITNQSSSPVSITFKPPYTEPYWTLCESVLNISLLFMLYVLVTLSRYAYVVSREPGNKMKRRRTVFLFYLCLFSIIMAMARNVSNQVVAFEGWKSDFACQSAVQTSYIFYALCLTAIFLFLWLRQNMFYTNPLLAQIIHPVAIFVSWFSIVFIVGGSIALTITYTVPEITGWRYGASSTGCRDVSDVERFVPRLLIYFTVAAHTLLLALLSYPLLANSTKPYSCTESKSIESMDVSSSYSTATSASNDKSNKTATYNKSEEKAQKKLKIEQGQKVVKFLQKTCLLTAVCICTDLAISSTQFFLRDGPELLYLTFYDINLMVNIVCCIATFSEWRYMLFPGCFERKRKRRKRKPESPPRRKLKLKRMSQEIEAKPTIKQDNQPQEKLFPKKAQVDILDQDPAEKADLQKVTEQVCALCSLISKHVNHEIFDFDSSCTD